MSYLHNDAELLKGIIPIQKKFLQRNQTFALEVREGFIFGRVIRRRICQWKPWPLIDANAATVDITNLTTQAELRFRDPRNPANSLLLLKSSTDSGWPWFFHGAFGIDPQYINMYLRYPEGDIIPGKFPNIDPIRPQAGDNISMLNSLVSPYEQPTDFNEVIIIPTKEIGAEYYNVDEIRRHNPVLNILFCLYWVQLFRYDTHPSLIADMALKRYEGAKATFLQHGFGNQPEELGPQLAKDWGLVASAGEQKKGLTYSGIFSLDEAAALGGR